MPKDIAMSDQQNSGSNGEKPKPPNNKKTETSVSPAQPEIVPPALESALRTVGVDPRDPNVTKALEISLTMMVSGTLPLAPPPILREYGNIRPELIDKLVEWTEQQAAHRRELEKLRTVGSEGRLDRSQRNALIVALGGLGLAAIVGIFGNMWAAIAIAVVSIGGPTAAIWLARNVRKPAAPLSPTSNLPVPSPPSAPPQPNSSGSPS